MTYSGHIPVSYPHSKTGRLSNKVINQYIELHKLPPEKVVIEPELEFDYCGGCVIIGYNLYLEER